MSSFHRRQIFIFQTCDFVVHFWLILEIHVCMYIVYLILYFFFINLSNIVCADGLAWIQKVEATDYQKLFTNSLVLVFILPKFASIGIFLRHQIRNDSIYTGVSTETCHAPPDRRFYLSLLWKESRHICEISQAARKRRVKRKPCRLFSRLTLDVSSNWVRTKHEMSRQKDSFDADSLQMF